MKEGRQGRKRTRAGLDQIENSPAGLYPLASSVPVTVNFALDNDIAVVEKTRLVGGPTSRLGQTRGRISHLAWLLSTVAVCVPALHRVEFVFVENHAFT